MSKKMGNATPYANKKWVVRSDNKTIFNEKALRGDANTARWM